MKFSKTSQLFVVSVIGLLVATALTACQLVTIDYVFLAGSKSSGTTNVGQIQVFAVDSESGALRNGVGPFNSGGATPDAMAVSPDYAHLYVANSDNNTVVHFTIASDGALTQKDTVTLAAAPVSLAVNPGNKYLYVVSGTTTATLTEYALSSGAIGSATAQETLTIPGYGGDTVVPTGVTVLPNNDAVFATVYDQSSYNPGGKVTSSAHPGWVFSYAVDSGGALTPAIASPYQAGVKPSAVAADPTSRFVYVTDYASNQLIGYGVTNNSTLNFLTSGPYRTGAEPSAVTIDPRGFYIYVANSLDSSVSAYSIELATGIPSSVVNPTGAQVNSTDTQPDAIAVDPALGRYVYTSNFLGNSISGFRLNPDTGALSLTQSTPYPSEAKPSAIVSIPHGNHSLQQTTP
ncbi:MAG TPA: beta-propeller fold lactonase family protein [Terracidiphilus sp.]|jgi:6-phosphogluconolactonase (cycloisomerase 2 family)|nr:beta-propeller fold lactonase family protein [Terracidiphilus sp.]